MLESIEANIPETRPCSIVGLGLDVLAMPSAFNFKAEDEVIV